MKKHPACRSASFQPSRRAFRITKKSKGTKVVSIVDLHKKLKNARQKQDEVSWDSLTAVIGSAASKAFVFLEHQEDLERQENLEAQEDEDMECQENLEAQMEEDPERQENLDAKEDEDIEHKENQEILEPNEDTET